MKYARLSGTGAYVPEKILSNSDLEKMVETSDDWIVERTGIKERRIAGESETSLTMAEQASRRAISAAELECSDIDLVIVATATPPRLFPSTACALQSQLGNIGCPAFDVTAACAGFNYALAVANQFIRGGQAKHALIVGSEVLSRVIDWTDRSTCVLFGDGAGAIVLSAADEPGVISTHLHSDGRHGDILYLNNIMPSERENTTKPAHVQMQGNDVFKVAVNALKKILDETLSENNLTKDDIDWFIPHQANFRIISALAKRIGLSLKQVIITIEKYGNTSSASVPMALDEAIRDGRIKRGDTILLESFGGGIAWGSALIKY